MTTPQTEQEQLQNILERYALIQKEGEGYVRLWVERVLRPQVGGRDIHLSGDGIDECISVFPYAGTVPEKSKLARLVVDKGEVFFSMPDRRVCIGEVKRVAYLNGSSYISYISTSGGGSSYAAGSPSPVQETDAEFEPTDTHIERTIRTELAQLREARRRMK